MEQVWAENMGKLKRVLTIGEVAEILRVHPTTIYRLVKRGDLPGFKIGGNWRINKASLDLWLSAVGPRPDPRSWPNK
jgi:excisionase family DNA binding protein